MLRLSRLSPPSNRNERLKLGLPPFSVAAQTLGEEYTDIWQSTSSGVGVSQSRRLALILLPVLPVYVAARLNVRYPPGDSTLGKVRQSLPATLEIVGEINLALFYLRGVYYDLVKRVLGIRYVRGLRLPTSMREGGLSQGPRFFLAFINGGKSRHSTTIVLSLGNFACHKIDLSTHIVVPFPRGHRRSFPKFTGRGKSNNRRSKRDLRGFLG